MEKMRLIIGMFLTVLCGANITQHNVYQLVLSPPAQGVTGDQRDIGGGEGVVNEAIELGRQRERLFRRIEKGEIPREEKITLVSRVLQYGMWDGLELAPRLGFSAKEILDEMATEEFIFKHHLFCQRLVQGLRTRKGTDQNLTAEERTTIEDFLLN